MKIPFAIAPTEVYAAMAVSDYADMVRKMREDQSKWRHLKHDIELVGSVVGWPSGFAGLHVAKEWLKMVGGGN